MPIIAATLASVRMSAGELPGCRIAPQMRSIAVNPKLRPSFHASRWTRNQTPRSPAW